MRLHRLAGRGVGDSGSWAARGYDRGTLSGSENGNPSVCAHEVACAGWLRGWREWELLRCGWLGRLTDLPVPRREPA